MKTINMLAALLVVGGMQGAAFAADQAEVGGNVPEAQRGAGSAFKLKRLDTDKDGAVSKLEYSDRRLKKFKELDANADAAIDGAEIEAPLLERAEYRSKRQLKKLDTNTDGKITRDEFQAGPRERFRLRDINSDGKLTAEDYPKGESSKRSWFGSGNQAEAEGKPRKARRAGLDTLEAVNAKSAVDFAGIDANADGAIDIDEIKKQASERIAFSKKRMLHQLDTDNDGRLSETEFMAKAVKRFATLDLNDDGRLASDDFAPSSRRWLFGR
jgi:Ca2+-binding EF-hand superfamily protein